MSLATKMVPLMLLLFAITACGGTSKPTGYTEQRTSLSNLTDRTSSDEYAADTSHPATLTQSYYDGDPISSSIEIWMKSKLPNGNWPGYANLKVTIATPDGKTITCQDAKGKKRAGTIFEPNHTVEVDCESFTDKVDSTVQIATLT